MPFVMASLNGRALLTLRVSLRRGARPSTFIAELVGEAPMPGDAVTLHVTDEATTREFRQFRVTLVESLADGRIRVHGADLRHDWAQLPVHARINVASGDGTAAPGPTLDLSMALSRMFAAVGVGVAPAAPAGVPHNLNLVGMPLNQAVALACARCGLSLGLDDVGEVRFEPATATAAEPDRARLIESRTATAHAATSVIGGQAVELLRLEGWQPVLPGDGSKEFPASEYFELPAMLGAWGISEAQARRAALGAAGFERLVPSTSAMGAARLEILRRHAFRLFRVNNFRGPWLPVGGANPDGTLAAPRLEAGGTHPHDAAPNSAAVDSFIEHGLQPVREGFELDCERGLVRLQTPPYALGAGDATLQSRVLVGPPKLRLTIARQSDLPPFRLGEGAAISAPHLVAVYDDGRMLNRQALVAAARELLHQAAPAAEHLLAGVDPSLAIGARELVEISADANGLLTKLVDAPLPMQFAESPETAATHAGDAIAPIPGGLHQPINLYRAGPLVLRASGTAPESESALATEAVARDPHTSALALAYPGPLAFPFFVASTEPARHGRWFFVAGVEAVADDKLRVMAPDDRHAELDAPDFSTIRGKRPVGLRGLLVSTAGAPEFVDAGPIVAHARGHNVGQCSNLVADLDGSTLSEVRRGGLQFLTVLALSPAHRIENVGGGPGFVPALNLRDGDTSDPNTCGRGLYAEGSGRSLGRLAAHNQGGPMLADAEHCSKHLYGVASDDGLYRESAGHISTDSFFKVPRDPVHDAPLAFYAQPFEGAPPPWPPFEAQIKYDESVSHRWNHQQRPGQWRIQYRVPFLPEIPPTWRPRIKEPPRDPPAEPPAEPRVPAMILPPESVRPAITEHELWAPSHDWLPVPSVPGPERDIPMRGPAVSSAGWATETGNAPDPGAGGGCIYLPPGRPLPLAQDDNGARQTFVVLHPEVLLAFGMPHHGLGRVHSGWQVALTGGDLVFTPVDAEALPDAERTLVVQADAEITGKLTVGGLIDPTGLELAPQSVNPGGVAGNTLWLDANDGNRAKVGTERLTTESELEALRAEVDELRARLDVLQGIGLGESQQPETAP